MRLGVVAILFLLAPADASACPDIGPFDPRRVSFGTVKIGQTSAPRSLEFHNYGPDAGELCTWMIDNGAFATVGSGCAWIEPGETVSLAVTCTPPTNGEFGAIWNLRSSSQDCDEREFEEYLGCTGGYFAAPVEVVLPSVHVDQMSQTSFTVTNTDPVAHTITALYLTSTRFTASVSGGLPRPLAPGASVEVSVTFDPDSPGNHDSYIRVLTGAEIGALVGLRAHALGQVQPELYDFQHVARGSRVDRPITIRNSGSTTRTITSTSFDHPALTISNVVGTELAPGASVAATVTFRPLVETSFASTLVIKFDDVPQPDTAFFRAYVVAPTFALHGQDGDPDDGLLEFGEVEVGSGTVARSVTLENTDTETWNVITCEAPPAPFGSPSAPCQLTAVPPSTSHTITISLDPSTVGDYFGAGQIRIVPAAGGFARSIAIAAYARVVPAPPFTVSTPELVFEGTPGTTQTITITNHRDTDVALVVALEGDAFGLDTPSSVVVPANGTADVVIRFAPLASGMFSGQLLIGEPGDPAPIVVTLDGTHEATAQGPAIPVPDGPPEDPPASPADGGCDAGGGATMLGAALVLGLIPRRRRCDGASRQRN
jgi:hypothetical protein